MTGFAKFESPKLARLSYDGGAGLREENNEGCGFGGNAFE
jgi:hypothetical protein